MALSDSQRSYQDNTGGSSLAAATNMNGQIALQSTQNTQQLMGTQSQSAGLVSYTRSDSGAGLATAQAQTPSMTTVLLPPSKGSAISLFGNPTLVTLETPPEVSSVSFVSANPNLYSQDRIQATVVSQQTAQNDYLNTILALSQSRQTLTNLNSSANSINQQLKIASDYLISTQNQHNDAIAQQQTTTQRIAQINMTIANISNQIGADQ